MINRGDKDKAAGIICNALIRQAKTQYFYIFSFPPLLSPPNFFIAFSLTSPILFHTTSTEDFFSFIAPNLSSFLNKSLFPRKKKKGEKF